MLEPISFEPGKVSSRAGAPKESQITMSSMKHKVRLAGAFAALLTLGLAVSCKGFFVNPTISSLAVGPVSPTIETGTTDNTVQMTVFATNSDGSTSNSPSVSWSINPSSTATISSTGLVRSVSVGTATITAASNQNPSITGTQSVTVTVGCIESIQVTPTSATPLSFANNNTSDTFSAEATTCNGSADITAVATWNAVPSTLATITGGVLEEVSGVTTTGTVAVTASVGSVTSNTVNVSVGP
jgi:trimeric autotransporter adhesin